MSCAASIADSGNYDSDCEKNRNEKCKVLEKSKKVKELIEQLNELEDAITARNIERFDRQEKMYLHILEWLNTINGSYCDCKTKDLLMKIYFASVKSVDSLYFDTFDRVNLKPKFTVGKQGNKTAEFFRPWGIYADFTGRILVADRLNHRIQIFMESGKFLLQFGEEGSDYGQFRRPTGVVVDKNWRIIVADKDNHRIQIFTFNGAFWFSFGKLGSKPGEFTYPWDVAVNSNCQIAVSDSQNHRVQLFDSRGKFIDWIDFRKDIPRGLAFRPDDSLMVTGFDSHIIKIFDKNFKFFDSFGGRGNNVGQFFRPQGLTCDESGRVAVSDSKNYRIQIFDSSGKFFKMFGTRGSASGEFDCPQGICFHPNGSLLVVDLDNNRFQVF